MYTANNKIITIGGKILKPTTGLNPVWLGLQSYWSHNETSGTSIADSKGTATGTLTNASARSASGKNGYCFATTTNKYWCDYGNNYQYPKTQAYSVSCWVKTAAYASDLFAILSNFDDSYSASIDIYANAGAINFGIFYLNNAGRRLMSKTGVITDNNWNHLVITHDGTQTGTWGYIYKNGVDMSATFVTSGTLPTSNLGMSLATGRRTSSVGYASNALVDEIGLWNRVLSLAEAQTLYAAGAGLFY